MAYTLSMFLVWGVALALIGGVMGWMLRSLKGRSQVARAREVDEQELAQLRSRVTELESVTAERDRLRMEVADVRGSSAGALGFSPSPRLDMEIAGTTLGRDIDLDDLTIVEGIGADIAELCADAGITTWRQLADTPVATLQRMLADGGDPVTDADPASWPQQAGLLADGRWEDFTGLTRELDSER